MILFVVIFSSVRGQSRERRTHHNGSSVIRMYRFMVQGLVHSHTRPGALPDTDGDGSIAASPQGNNITHLNVARIESFPALMIHLNKSAFFILPT